MGVNILKILKPVIALLIVFILGWTASSIASNYDDLSLEKPFSPLSIIFGPLSTLKLYTTGIAPEISSPANWIEKNNIHVTSKGFMVDIDNPSWAEFTDTNSMDPVFDKDHNIVRIKVPVTELKPGDIISFRYDDNGKDDSSIIIHRIYKIGYDDKGWFAITKGDNVPTADTYLVREEDVLGVTVAVLY